MKAKFKRLTSLIICLVMLTQMFPGISFAASEPIISYTENGNPQDGVRMTKTSVYDPDTGEMTITLEAYTTGTVVLSERTLPTDIVLVMDTSGSMDYDFTGSDNRMEALQNAVNAFIDHTEELNADIEDEDDRHAIALVTFASSSNVLADFTPVTDEGADSLRVAIETLNANGATAVHYGLDDALTLLTDRQTEDGGAYQERAKVVIVFTDGEPTTSSSYSDSVAYQAVNNALLIKNMGAQIYTIGIFDDADPEGTDQLNTFMNYVSSNYPNAYGHSEGFLIFYTYTIHAGDGPYGTGYYKTADNTDDLTTLFENISSEVGHPTKVLGESATLMDIVSDYFKIENLPGGDLNINLYTSDYLGGNDFSDPDNWDDPESADSTITWEIDGGDTVRVNGFDYDANYVSSNARNGFYGKKLILEIVTTPDYDAIDRGLENGDIGNAEIPTNDTAALLDSSNINVAWTSAPKLEVSTVTYKVNEGGELRTVGEYYRFPGSETRLMELPIDTDEYTYGDWYSDDDVTISAGYLTMPEELGDFTIISDASPKEYNVTYEYRGNVPDGTDPITAPSGGVYEVGETVPVEEVIAPAGYEFSGWIVEKHDVVINADSFEMPARDLHFYGYFIAQPSEWNVEYYFEVLDDTPGTVDYNALPDLTETFTAETGSTVTAAVPARTGFEHDTEAANITTGTVTADGELTLKIYYKRAVYEVSYEYFGDLPIDASELPETKEYRYGEEVEIAPDATAEGYTFSGWSIRTGATSIEGGVMAMPASNVVLRGTFNANSETPYIIEHYFEDLDSDDKDDPDNYTINEDYTQELSGVTDTTAYAVPLSSGDIRGFTYEPDMSVTTDIIEGDGSTVLRIYYSRTRHTVIYQLTGVVPAGTTAPVSKEYKYGEEVTVEDDFDIEGYNFSGWTSEDVSITGAGDTFEMPYGDVVITGTFSYGLSEYTVEHYLMDTNGNYPAVSDHIHEYTDIRTGTPVTATVAVHVGFTFDASNPLNITEATVTADGNTVLKLYYERNQYEVTYEYIGIVPPDADPEFDPVTQQVTAQEYTGTYYYGQEVEIAPDATDGHDGEHYTFSGWSIRTGATSIEGGVMVMPDSNVVLRGAFIPTGDTTYYVEHHFETLDGEYECDDTKTQTFEGAASETATAIPLSGSNITGYTFNADESNDSRTGMITSSEPLVLILYYDLMESNVRYQYTGNVPAGAVSQLPDAETYKYSETVDIEDEPYIEGYVFSGWRNDELGIDKGITSFEMPAHEVTLTGHFTPLPTYYIVEHYLMGLDGEYDDNPEHSFEVSGVYVGESIEASTSVSHTGFTFDEDTTGEQYMGTAAPESDGVTVLKVYFERNKYKLSYTYDHTDAELDAIEPNPASDELPTEIEYFFGEEIELEADPTALGYIFTGWSLYTGDGEIADGKIVMPAKNITIHGAFNADPNVKYTVEHYLENLGSEDASDTDNYTINDDLTEEFTGSTGTSVTAIPRADGSLVGYSFNAELSDTYRTGFIARDGSLVLMLYYKRIENKVIYEFEGNVPEGAEDLLPEEETHKYGDTVTPSDDDMTIEGYTFSGWHLPENAGFSLDSDGNFTMPERTVYLVGYYSANPSGFTVEHYKMNGDGTYPDTPALSMHNTVGVYVNDNVTATPLTSDTTFEYDEDATREAAVADGLTMAETSGVDTPYGEVDAAGSLVIKLYYSRKTYDLDYAFTGTVPAGAELPEGKDDIIHGSTVELEDPTVPAGYIFDGWYHNQALVAGSLVMPAADTTVYGSFRAKTDVKYTVKYLLEELDGTYTETYSKDYYGTTGTYVAGPRLDYPGFTFNMNESTWNGHIKGDGTLILELKYDRNVRTVYYHYHDTPPAGVNILWNGSDITDPAPYGVIGSHEYKYGETVTVEPILSADDDSYTFRGWFTSNLSGFGTYDEVAAGHTFTMPDHDINFYGAVYNYVVVYDLNGGTVDGSDTIEPKEVEWPDAGLLPASNPTKEGMLFSGWTHEGTEGYISANTKYSELAVFPYVDVIVLTAEYADGYNVSYNWGTEDIPEGVSLPTVSFLFAEGDVHTVDTAYTAGMQVEKFSDNGTLIGVYTFSGWDKTGDIIISSSIIINGSWDYEPVVYPPEIVTGSVSVTKVDAADHDTVLSGVVFDLYSADGERIGTYTTDKSGSIYVSGLEAGSYYWLEVRSAAGYARDESEHRFTVNAGRTTSMVIENGKSEIPDAFGIEHYAYIIGYEDGTVRPNAKITRAEVATIFFRLLNEETRRQNMTRENEFSDVNEGNWFNTAVSTMAAMGIVNGYPDGTFRPQAYITRAEFAALAARFDKYGNDTDASFTDIYDHWAKREINIAANNGWVLGYEDGTFRPNQYITRAEAMTMVNRVLQRIPQYVTDLLPDMVTWIDNMDTNRWYYLMVQEATNSHFYGRKPNGYEYWTELREVPNWAELEK